MITGPIQLVAPDVPYIQTFITIPAAGVHQLVTQNATRYALFIHNPAASQLNIWPVGGPALTSQTGIVVGSLLSAYFAFPQFGGMVCDPWYYIGTATAKISVLEILYRPGESSIGDASKALAGPEFLAPAPGSYGDPSRPH